MAMYEPALIIIALREAPGYERLEKLRVVCIPVWCLSSPWNLTVSKYVSFWLSLESSWYRTAAMMARKASETPCEREP